VEPRVGVALILIGIRISFEIGKTKPGTVGGSPHLVCFIVFPAEQAVDGTRALDRLDELGARPPQHQANGVLAITIGVVCPLAKHTVGFAAPARATEEHLKNGALQERHLRRVAAGRPSDLLVYCTLFSAGAGSEYFFSHSSSLNCAGTSTT